LDLDPEVFSDIAVALRLDFGWDRVLVLLDAVATATLTCDRTLVSFDQPVQASYTVLFAAPDVASDEDGRFEDVRLLQPNDQYIDLTDPVRDTLLLALPVRRVAPGAEDVELPTRFGAPDKEDDAIDPRWAALRSLSKDGD
jgi:uncharacterized protein